MTEPNEEQISKFDQLVEQMETSLSEVKQTQALAIETSAEVKATKAGATDALQTTKQVLDEVNALLAQAKTNQQELQALLEKSTTNSAKTAEIARIADEKDARVNQYETQLSEMHENYEEIRQKIESIISGATSAGLAKAFNARKEALAPTLNWSRGIFILSVIGFLSLGVWAIFYKDINTFPQFVIFSLVRSPLILGLILLEEFSRRLYGRTLKLEEDYAYKETLSLAFDGYQKALGDVQSASKDTLAHTLGSNVLAALKDRPGRLLEQEKDGEDISIKTVISQMQPDAGGVSASLITKLYDDLKRNFKGSVAKAILIIVLALVVGVAIGRYSDQIFRGLSSQQIESSESTSTL